MEYIVDNSAWQRVGNDPEITDRVLNLEKRYLVASCPPQVLEYCRSARTSEQYRSWRRRMERLYPAPVHPGVEDVLEIQEAMRRRGIDIRQAAVADTVIAAYAVVNGMTVVAADRDFEYISEALDGKLAVEYLAPSA